MRKFVAKDELLDSIDSLDCKIKKCIEAGMSVDDVQVFIDEYHDNHVDYPVIKMK